MNFQYLAIIASCFLITGCSSTGSVNQNQHAAKIVSQVNPSNVERPDLKTLTASFADTDSTSPYSGSVVELSGKVIAFALTEDDLYTVTMQDGETTVICVFDSTIADQLGGSRTISGGATITVQGQCFASGLFSSSAFTLNGCKLVTN